MTALDRRKTLLGMVIIVVGAIVYVVDYTGFVRGLFQGNDTTIKAVFASAPQLQVGDPVRVGGVEVGKVTRVKVASQGREAVVEMGVEDEALPLYQDARAELRWRTLLGANFVVNVDRGHASSGKLGDHAIAVGHTSTQVEFDDIASVFGGDPQRGFRTLLQEVPHALSNHDAPDAAARALAHASPSLSAGLRAIRGRREGDLTRLVRSTAATVAALDAPARPVRDLVEGGATTLHATAEASAALGDSIVEAARALPRATATMPRLRATLRGADPLIARLSAAAPFVAPALARLRPTVVHGSRLLSAARPLLSSLRPAARSLAAVGRSGLPVIEGIEPGLERLDRKVLPDLARRSPESKHTTYEMIGPFFASLDAAFSSFDKVTNFVRFLASGGGDSIDALPCRSFFADPSRNDIVSCNSIMETLKGLLAPPMARRSRP